MSFFAPGPGLPPTGHLAPDFRVEVEGRELDESTKGDVLELKVVMDIDNMTSADISFNDWDDARMTVKHSDSDRIAIGGRVHVQMGYAGRLLTMLRGQIDSLSPKFPQSGSPTITVGVLDNMQLLKDRKPAEGEEIKYVGKADWQIAEAVARRNGLTAEVTREGPVHALVVQKNQDDAAFLVERAKRIDFDCYIHIDPASEEAVLRFMKPTDERAARRVREHRFAWGETLISFSPTMTLSGQVSEVTVRGWDPARKAPIVATATAADLPGAGSGTSGPEAVAQALRSRRDVTVDAPVTSEEEARELAVSLLRERAYEFITGSGEVIGLPDMRPGDNLVLERLGRRFSGSYYVRKVEHEIGSGGYLSRFEVRKVFEGSGGG